MKKLRFLVPLLVAALAMLSASVMLQAQDEDPIVFGFVVDETGVGAIFAKSQIAGLEIALEDLNAKGGILGREVTYIKRDSQLDASVGATIAEQFILEDGVDFLLGPTSSGVALAISEIAKQHKIPIAFHTSNTVKLSIDNWNPYMLQVVPHTNIEARAAALFASEQEFTDWATIAPDYAFGRDSFGAFQPRFAELKPEATIVTEQWPALAERDMVPFLTAIQANSPEAVYSALWGDQLVTFVSAANDFGLFEESQFIGLFDMDVMKALGDDLPEGLLGYSRAPFYAIDTEEMAVFVEKYHEKTGEYPSDWGIMIYDAVMGLATAAEQAGSVEGDAVAAEIPNLVFTSLRGELTVRECDHMANVGEYVGVTSQNSEYDGLPILTDVRYIPAEELWDSCEDIIKIREAAAAAKPQ